MAEEKLSPISAAKPPAVNPLGTAASTHASTLKLKPVIRKPVIGGGVPKIAKPSPASPLPAAPQTPPEQSSINQLKNVTQKLKDITQQIPQQAILRKTAHISDQTQMTEAQKQASKSRTARISLSEAVGAAPVSNEAAPMKTIRIKRPSDIAAAPSGPAGKKITAKLAEPEAPSAGGADSAKPEAEPPAPEPTTSLTQRKTLKISRPGAVRPSKLGLKKSGESAPKAKSGEPAAEGTAPDTVADIPDIPPLPAPSASVQSAPEKTSWMTAFSFVVQYAACVGMAFLGWLLYTDLSTKWF